MRFVLAYDVSEDRRRARVARRLERAGQRCQGSVFLIEDTEDAVLALVDELARSLDPRTDRVQAWRLVAGQPAAGIARGQVPDLEPRAVVLLPGRHTTVR